MLGGVHVVENLFSRGPDVPRLASTERGRVGVCR